MDGQGLRYARHGDTPFFGMANPNGSTGNLQPATGKSVDNMG